MSFGFDAFRFCFGAMRFEVFFKYAFRCMASGAEAGDGLVKAPGGIHEG